MQAMLRFGRIAIVAVWCALLLALARAHWPPAAPSDRPIGAVQTAEDAWMGVYLHGQKVGFSHSRVSPTADGYDLEESSLLRLTVLDQVQTVRAEVKAAAAGDFSLRTFTVAIDSGLGPFD